MQLIQEIQAIAAQKESVIQALSQQLPGLICIQISHKILAHFTGVGRSCTPGIRLITCCQL